MLVHMADRSIRVAFVLGDFGAGAVASAISVPFSIVSGGLACVVGAFIIARKMPELDAYVDEHAALT